MFNGKKSVKNGPFRQLGLFDKISADPELSVKISADPVQAIKGSLRESVKDCPLSRDQIVDLMNSMMAMASITCNGRSQKVTLALLDKWCAPGSTDYMIPLRLLPIFCRAVGSTLPIRVYSSFFDQIKIISCDEHKMLQWAQEEINARKHKRKANRLAPEIGL